MLGADGMLSSVQLMTPTKPYKKGDKSHPRRHLGALNAKNSFGLLPQKLICHPSGGMGMRGESVCRSPPTSFARYPSQVDSTEVDDVSDTLDHMESFEVEEPNAEAARRSHLTLDTAIVLYSDSSPTEEEIQEASDFVEPRCTNRSVRKPDFCQLSCVVCVEGMLYYIHNGTIESAHLEQPTAVDEQFKLRSTRTRDQDLPENAQLLKAESGKASFLTWDNCSTHTSKSTRLTQEDSTAVPVHQSIQGSVLGHKSFSEGIHCWTVECTDIHNTTLGIVSKVGVESFHNCRIGAIPPFVACISPGYRFDHKVHWVDIRGKEHAFTPNPPLSSYLSHHSTVNEIAIIINFHHRTISFICNGSAVATVCLEQQGVDILVGDHTIFAHLKFGAQVKLVHAVDKFHQPLSAVGDLPPPKILAGNPYIRWGREDGIGVNSVFEMPLGMCYWNNFLWITDTDVIRKVSLTGEVTTHTIRMSPYNCQPPIQYLGVIHAMRNKLFVTDLTNRTIISIDPVTWEGRLCMLNGKHGFRPCNEERRNKIFEIINEVRIYDTATAVLSPSIEQFLAGKLHSINWNSECLANMDSHTFGLMGLAHVAPAWLFVTDSEDHCLYYADLSNDSRGSPAVCAGCPGEPGRADGTGHESRLRHPTTIVGDQENLLLYVSDTGNRRIVKLQLVWNDTSVNYTAQVSSMYHTVSLEDGDDAAFYMPPISSLASYNGVTNCLIAADSKTTTLYQIGLQSSIKTTGPTFASPYDNLVMMLKQSKRDAENMPQVSKEHCKTLGKALDLLMSTPNIYQYEYVGGGLDDDVARFLSNTYAPTGLNFEGEDAGDEGPESRRMSTGSTDSDMMHRRRTSTGSYRTVRKHTVTNNPMAVRFGEESSRALGIEIPNLDSLSFSIFDANNLCEDNGGVFVHVCMNVFSKYRFFPKYFGTPELVTRFIQFLHKVQSGYHRDNPYHNAIHAADVVQTVHWLLNASGIIQKLTDIDCIAILLAAAIHDYDHPVCIFISSRWCVRCYEKKKKKTQQ